MSWFIKISNGPLQLYKLYKGRISSQEEVLNIGAGYGISFLGDLEEAAGLAFSLDEKCYLYVPSILLQA